MRWTGQYALDSRAFHNSPTPGFAPFLIGTAVAFSMLSMARAAESPQELLAAGRVDQALQILDRQIQAAPTAEAYNLLCRAHFELGAWNSGISACEKATALATYYGLFYFWLV